MYIKFVCISHIGKQNGAETLVHVAISYFKIQVKNALHAISIFIFKKSLVISDTSLKEEDVSPAKIYLSTWKIISFEKK